MAAPIKRQDDAREQQRINVIRRLKLASARNPARFHGIVRTAAHLFAAPSAAITILDDHSQWFYAKTGLDLDSSPRQDAFCRYTIRSDDAFVVEDARLDPRFRDNPFVTAPPHIRFYAGSPIIFEPGVRLGALIVIDSEPRRVDASTIELLNNLSVAAADAFRLQDAALRQQKLAASLAHEHRIAAATSNQLQETQQLLDVVSDLASFGTWSFDRERGDFESSPGLQRLHALDAEDTASIETIRALYHEEAFAELDEAMAAISRDRRRFIVEIPMTIPGRAEKWIRWSGRADDDPASRRVLGCVLDVTQQKRSQQAVETVSTRDALTGLHNRRAIVGGFDRHDATTVDGRSSIVVLRLDLDDFKRANEHRGHLAGDEALREVAKILRDVCRRCDDVGRIGGDEFILLAETNIPDCLADAICNRIFERFSTSELLQAAAPRVTCSIGVAFADAQTNTSEALRRADIALSEAKRRGRGCAVVYEDDLEKEWKRRRAVLSSVDAAIAEGRLRPAYQPKVDLVSGEVHEFEALARIVDRDGQLLGPGSFAAALEEPLYATKISDTVLATAIHDAGALRERGIAFDRVAVNVTEFQLMDDLFVEKIQNLLAAANLSPQNLGLEITENILLSKHSEQMKRQLDALSEIGVEISFDDFGTGFASLTHLLQYKVDRIKIDKSFIIGIETDQRAFVIVKAIAEMARELRIDVVAEGVETAGAAAIVRGMGCRFAQGFHYAKPLPFQALAEMLAANRSFASSHRSVGVG